MYLSQVFYIISLTLIKASILFMFLRIFPGEKFRLWLWATQVFNMLIGIAFFLVGIFQCQPLNLAWTFWSEEREGKCIDMPQMAIIHGCINIALDVWMLVLPATQVWGLNTKWRRKIAVLLMFSLGFL